MAKIAFLGLGVMGYPMAGHLLKKGGHGVTVYNRSPFDRGRSTEHNTCAFIQYPVSAQALPAVDVDSQYKRYRNGRQQ